MTTCPMCDDIRVICYDPNPFELGWHIACKCGFAWAHGSPCRTQREAKDNWERFLREWEKNLQRESIE